MKKIKGIYVVEFINGCKLGISDNCHERIKVYKSPWCMDIKLVGILSCQYPRIVEQKVLSYFKGKRQSEFIYKSFDEIVKAVNYNRYSVPDGMLYDKLFKSRDWLYLRD